MIALGYPERFCHLISESLRGEWSEMRMMGYLREWGRPSMEEVADEMLAILSDRERIVNKKMSEQANASYNAFLRRDIDEEKE